MTKNNPIKFIIVHLSQGKSEENDFCSVAVLFFKILSTPLLLECQVSAGCLNPFCVMFRQGTCLLQEQGKGDRFPFSPHLSPHLSVVKVWPRVYPEQRGHSGQCLFVHIRQVVQVLFRVRHHEICVPY